MNLQCDFIMAGPDSIPSAINCQIDIDPVSFFDDNFADFNIL